MTSRNLNRTPTQKMKKFVFNSEKCIYILSTWNLCCFASFAQPVFFFLIFFGVTCQLTWLYQPIVTNIWFKSEWTWKIWNYIKTTVVMEELYWKFSWWEILDDLTAFILQRDWITCCWLKYFFVFFFALHGGNKPPYSCESGCRPASVSRMYSEWCYWLWTKSKAFRHELSPPHNYKNTHIIYKSPPQRSIHFVLFMSRIFVYYSFFFKKKKTCFICVHTILLLFFGSCFQRREQCWREDGVKILCPKFTIIKFLERVLCWVKPHAFPLPK